MWMNASFLQEVQIQHNIRPTEEKTLCLLSLESFKTSMLFEGTLLWDEFRERKKAGDFLEKKQDQKTPAGISEWLAWKLQSLWSCKWTAKFFSTSKEAVSSYLPGENKWDAYMGKSTCYQARSEEVRSYIKLQLDKIKELGTSSHCPLLLIILWAGQPRLYLQRENRDHHCSQTHKQWAFKTLSVLRSLYQCKLEK